MIQIGSDIATKELELTYETSTGKYTLTQNAYGEMWDDEFDNREKLEEYLKDRWNLSLSQINELYADQYEI